MTTIVATMSTLDVLAIVLLGVVALTIPVLVHHELTKRRQLAVARVRHTRPVQSSGYSVDIWRQRTREAEDVAEQLRREVWLARQTSDELAHQLAASRQIGRRQERDRLALTTLVIEANQTGQMPAVVPSLAAPTATIPTVTPLTHHHRRRVLRSA